MKATAKTILCLQVFTFASAYAADDFAWNVAGPADWNNAGNWVNVNIGAGNQDRFVNNGGVAEITSNTNLPIRDIKIGVGGGTSGTVNNLSGVHASGGGNWAIVGQDGGNGTYNLSGGAGAGTYTGRAAGTGSLTASRLYVGGGAGSAGAIGMFRMNTSGSVALGSDLVVGDGGGNNGTFNMDAGTVTSNGWSFIGINGATGTMRISSGTFNPNNRLYIGTNGGTGTLTLSGNAVVNANEVKIADNQDMGGATGSGTLNVSGNASITSASYFQVGRFGSVGHVNQSGGMVNVNSGWFGIANDSALSSGSDYLISGGDLKLNNGVSAEVGADTLGTLGVSGNGTVTGSNLVIIGFRNGGSGILNVSGNGTVDAANGVSVGNQGGATGTVNLNGGTIFAPTIGVGAGTGQLNFNGGVFKAKSNQAEFLPGFNTANSEILANGAKINTNGFDIQTSVGFDGIGGLTKQGNGKLTLNGVSTYSGATIISQGTLALGVGGSLNPSSVVNIFAGATFDGSAVAGGLIIPNGQTLKGNGTAIGDVKVNGTIAPGNSIGTLTITGNLTLSGVTDMEIDRTGAPAFDEILVSGNLTYGGTLNVTLLAGTLQLGDTFDLFDGGTIAGSFSSINFPALSGDWYWADHLSTTGDIQVLPEPGSALLSGLAAFGLLARRRRARAEAPRNNSKRPAESSPGPLFCAGISRATAGQQRASA